MKRARDAFLLVFLALQLAAALPGLVKDRHETRGDFSWNMYSARYRCRVHYEIELPDGTRHPVRIEKAFNEPDRTTRVFHRDRLPGLHAFLCDHREDPRSRIEGSVACSLNAEPAVELIERAADVCSAANRGVLR